MNFSVTRFGIKLDESKYTWDERTKTFSTNEDNLVLDFTGIDGVVFITGPYCTFGTGSHCSFRTGAFCTFKTGPYCTFDTYSYCIFDTGYSCIFKTGKECVVIRRDVYEIIELKEKQKIQLNGRNKKCYKVIDEKKTIIVDGKEVEISLESYEAIKKQMK